MHRSPELSACQRIFTPSQKKPGEHRALVIDVFTGRVHTKSGEYVATLSGDEILFGQYGYVALVDGDRFFAHYEPQNENLILKDPDELDEY